MSRRIRTYRDVADPTGEDVVAQVARQRERLRRRMADVGAVVAVGSGKGGVGKSAVAANLAAALAGRDLAVGALDADLNGPALARMLGATGPVVVAEGSVDPPEGAAGVRVMSMDLLLESDAPPRWRAPDAEGATRGVLERNALREFLADVAWGPLDLLVLDLPPGSDALEGVLELLPGLDLLLLVTTPSEAARGVVARSVRAAREKGADRLALVANMTRYVCPHCGAAEPLYSADGVRALAGESGLDVWAEIPFEPALAAATDAGFPYVLEAPGAPATGALEALAARVVDELRERTA